MKRLVGITFGHPADLGPAIGDVREMLRLTRDQLAQQIAARTGTTQAAAVALLRRWETGDKRPTLDALGPVLDALGPVLDALGCDLALIPREDT